MNKISKKLILILMFSGISIAYNSHDALADSAKSKVNVTIANSHDTAMANKLFPATGEIQNDLLIYFGFVLIIFTLLIYLKRERFRKRDDNEKN